MASTPEHPLSSLASRISNLAHILERMLMDNDLPPPSLDINGPSEYPTSLQSSSEKFSKTRYAIVDAAHELIRLTLGPKEALFQLSFSHHDCSSLAVISRHSIADVVPLDKAVSYAEISAATSLSEHQARSVIRHAITNGIFQEPSPGYVAHNALSRLLLDPAVAALVGHNAEDIFPATAKLVECWDAFPGSSELNETAFSLAVGEKTTYFEYLDTHKRQRDRLRQAMTGLTSGGSHDTQHLVKGYRWDSLPAGATVVDVGGSGGALAIALVKEYPSLKLVVQDLPGVVAESETNLPAELETKIKFLAHDFFSPQPVEADLYLLRHILHDWPDKYCISILRQLVGKMNPESRIIVNDAIMSEMKDTTVSEYRMMSAMNLQMVTLFHSKERSLNDWKALFTEADQRLTLQSVTTPVGSEMSIMELALT